MVCKAVTTDPMLGLWAVSAGRVMVPVASWVFWSSAGGDAGSGRDVEAEIVPACCRNFGS